MVATAKEIYQEAEDLYNNASDEIKYRNASSRLYYGLFHLTQEFLKREYKRNSESLPGSTHQRLSDFFQSSAEHPHERRLKVRQMGIKLQRAHADRCWADYQINKDYNRTSLDVQYKLCVSIVDLMAVIPTL